MMNTWFNGPRQIGILLEVKFLMNHRSFHSDGLLPYFEELYQSSSIDVDEITGVDLAKRGNFYGFV